MVGAAGLGDWSDDSPLIGEKFLEPLRTKPVSAFIADGSHVEVQRRTVEP